MGTPRKDVRRLGGAMHARRAAFEPFAVPAVVFTDPEIAWAGLTEEHAKRLGISYRVAAYPWAASGRAHSLGRPDGLVCFLGAFCFCFKIPRFAVIRAK